VVVGLTEFSREAQDLLRDPSQFKWYVVALLAFVFYVYAVEVERRRWDIVLAGLAFWLVDWVNEIVNSLILHFSDRAPLWAITGDTAYLVLIGLTIEISVLFLVTGIVFVKTLPADPRVRILGIPNRWFLATVFSCVCVFVEILLHDTGYFHWAYGFWTASFPLLIVIFGYLTFFAAAFWVYDMGSDRRRQLRVVGALAAVDATALIAFGPILGWI
jgi:hypothetical protein